MDEDKLREQMIIGSMKTDYKIWLSLGRKPIMGAGRYKMLKAISRTHSLKETARLLNISYRTCQEYIKRMEERVGAEVVHTERGGINAGGRTDLTELGRAMVKKFESIKAKVMIDDKRQIR